MTTLLSSYVVDKAPIFSVINGRIYVTNDHSRVQVWDGLYTTMRDAGIAAPTSAPQSSGLTKASGNGTAGTHLVRYRYIDSTSPAATYRSNASGQLSVTIATASTEGQLTFSVASSATAGSIIRSTDTKVDTIRLEMTEASGSTFYVVTDVANTATSAVASVTDTNLALNELAGTFDTNTGTTDAGQGHEQPPLASIITSVKNYTFLGGFHARTYTVGVTLSSTNVTGTGFSSLLTGRMLRVAGDTVSYEIASSTSTTITLTKNYAGSTNAAAVVTLFPKAPNRIYWSAFPSGATLPESWKVGTRARDVLNGTGDTIRGMTNWQGDLLIAGLFSMDRLIFVDDPSVGELQSVPGKFGVWNQRCFVVVDQSIYGWGPNGAWVMRGGSPGWISRPIDTTVASVDGSYMDISAKDQFHGYYDPISKAVIWVLVKTGETTPREGIAYELQQGRWYRVQFRQGIDSSTNAADTNGKFQAVLSDSTNGYTWYNTGATDGVPSSSNGAYTVASSTSTSTMVLNEALPSATATGGNLSGVILYRPSTGEEKVISSNTSSTITLGAAFSTSIAAGESMYAGAIPWYIVTDWWGGSLATKKRPHLHLTFQPTTGGVLRVRLYQDFGTSPFTFTIADSAEWPKGVSKPSGSQTYVDVSMDPLTVPDGFVCIPLSMDFKRVWKARVDCISPAGTLKFADASFDITSKRDSKVVTNE